MSPVYLMVQWLGHWPLVQRVPGSILRSSSTGFYVRRGWFTGIELFFGPPIWVQFIPFWCLRIQLCNSFGQRLCAYKLPKLTELSILSG